MSDNYPHRRTAGIGAIDLCVVVAMAALGAVIVTPGYWRARNSTDISHQVYGAQLTGSRLLAKTPLNATALPLWPEGAPGALGKSAVDIPTITPFLVATETGGNGEAGTSAPAAMVIFPGGGYSKLADHEGADYAHWFNEQGIDAFVVKYRLGSSGYHHPAMLNDAARAVRLVRARAGEWNIDPQRVGIIGSSAGGHLASTLATHFDAGDAKSTDSIERQSSRPDLAVLCYPVITMGPLTHAGSKRMLLGENPPDDLVKLMSNELQVSGETPPCFLFHTADDKVVPVQNSLMFARALADHSVSFSLHVYPHGRHGLGLGAPDGDVAGRHPWVGECEAWLREQNFASPRGNTGQKTGKEIRPE